MNALGQLAELFQVDDGLVGVLVTLLPNLPVDVLDELLAGVDLLADALVILLAPLLHLLVQHRQQPILLPAERLPALRLLLAAQPLVGQTPMFLRDPLDAPSVDEAEVESLRSLCLLRGGRRVG